MMIGSSCWVINGIFARVNFRIVVVLWSLIDVNHP